MSDKPVIWVVQDFLTNVPHPRFSLNWLGPNAETESGTTDSFSEALAWARSRAPRVRVRVAVGVTFDERIVYSAGAEPISGLLPLGGIPPAHRQAKTSGFAFITEDPYDVEPAKTFHLESVESLSGGGSSRHREDGHYSFTEALAAARARADVVIIRTGAPGMYKDYNAGSEDFPSSGPIPRWTG